MALTGGCNGPTCSAHRPQLTLSLGPCPWDVDTQRRPSFRASAVVGWGAVERWESDTFVIFKAAGVRRGCSRLEPQASQEGSTQLGRRSAGTGHKDRPQQQSHPVPTG